MLCSKITYKSLIDFAIAIEDQNFYQSEKIQFYIFCFCRLLPVQEMELFPEGSKPIPRLNPPCQSIGSQQNA